jgi:hypothetical protein
MQKEIRKANAGLAIRVTITLGLERNFIEEWFFVVGFKAAFEEAETVVSNRLTTLLFFWQSKT